MSYTINRYDGTVLVTINDNTINNETPLQLLGRGVDNYGERIAENFAHLLENFARNTQPVNPVLGQLWFHKDAGGAGIHSLKLCVDEGADTWNEVGLVGKVARRVSVPATPTSSGQIGDYATSSNYIYFCVAPNSWVRTTAAIW
jgi:hypothetical protein